MAHPQIAALLVELFQRALRSRAPPTPRGGRRASSSRSRRRSTPSRASTRTASCATSSPSIRAMLRTNYFQRGDGRRAEAVPLVQARPGAAAVAAAAAPAASRSSSTRRASRACTCAAARSRAAGIRWSDRREDFRTEVLGLMKAQMVKNAVIVPVGAKGGFVVKRPPAAATATRCTTRSSRCYRTFIRGLLDVTDNIVDGEIVPPPDVVRYDDDDPYLVVAADKGTATFSDIANAISRRVRLLAGRRVRLGRLERLRPQEDGHHRARRVGVRQAALPRARASTSRREDFTVVGIGDMSGDVFGNGMLLSPHIRLVGRLRPPPHLHRPRSRPGRASFEERRRLFELPRSSWDDYDRDLISEGGGVYSRSAKSIALSPQARAALGIDERDADAERADPRHPARARRPALERRHRHLRQGRARRRTPRSATRPTTRVRVDARRPALPRGRRGRQPRA